MQAKRNGTYIEPQTIDDNGNPVSAESTDSDDTISAGKTAVYGVAGTTAAYAGYKTSKAVYNVAKFGAKGAKAITNIASKKSVEKVTENVTEQALKKVKPKPGKILSFLKSMKSLIIKKFGKTGAAKLLAKLAGKISTRLVPFLGAAMLAYDAIMIAKYMIYDKLSFKSAVSKAIIGVDIFSDETVLTDENGEPIKPGAAEEDAYIAAEIAQSDKDEAWLDRAMKKRDAKTKNVPSAGSKNRPANNRNYGGSFSKTNSKSVDIKDVDDSETVDLNNQPRNRTEVKNLLDKVGSNTGVDPATLKTFAAIESGMDPNAKASTSSASGLFQFIKRTWNSMLTKHGKEYGIPKGTSPFSAEANATMGAEFIKDNAKVIKTVKPNINATDLYLAHFLGAGAAKKFLKADPNEIASRLFPAPAMANKSIFFTRDGRPRTIGEVYHLFNNKIAKREKTYGITGATDSDTAFTNNNTVNNTVNNSTTSVGKPMPRNTVSNNDWYAKQQALQKGDTVKKEAPKKQEGFKTKQQVKETLSTAKTKQHNTLQKDTMEHVNIEHTKASSEKLSNIDNTLKQSLQVQMKMADTLDKILHNNLTNDKLKEDVLKETEKNKPVNNNTPSNTSMPKPAVDISRRSYGF